MQIYIVKPGDSIDLIASEYEVTSNIIIYDNQLIYPYALTVGQALLINDTNSYSDKTSAFSDGYAYPFISPWVLQQTLPFLSSLLVFSYGFTADGNLVPPNVSDNWMISLSLSYDVNPILVLTPLDSSGKFNNNLITAIVHSDEAKYNLIEQLIQTMKTKGYVGLDIDFEYILADDRDSFTKFVEDVTYEMNAVGYTVSVALAPKTSSTQQGLLYQGKDYKALGAAANHVLLMTYEWGYKYGPPMAVAPINMVKRVVNYAITEIDPQKINIGIPNYGYDWPLPYIQNETVATTIGNVQAIQIAIAYGSEILFDEIAQSPYFYYTTNGISHVVWFEDVRSIQAKFQLVKDYNLRGMSYWQIMRWWRANWLLQQDTFTIL